jgi:hypothetical protein
VGEHVSGKAGRTHVGTLPSARPTRQ